MCDVVTSIILYTLIILIIGCMIGMGIAIYIISHFDSEDEIKTNKKY